MDMWQFFTVNCSTPSTNPNVTFDPYQSTTEGSVISYQCRPGFIQEGKVMSVCGVNGSWVPDPDQHSCREGKFVHAVTCTLNNIYLKADYNFSHSQLWSSSSSCE